MKQWIEFWNKTLRPACDAIRNQKLRDRLFNQFMVNSELHATASPAASGMSYKKITKIQVTLGYRF